LYGPPAELAALEAKVDAALAAYEELSEGTKMQLAAEKAKLDALKTKIGHVQTAHAFQDNHAEALAQTPEGIEGGAPEEVAGLLPKLQAALAAAKALPKTAQGLVQDDIAPLESLATTAEAFKYAIAFYLNGGDNSSNNH
jgi:hypothetical protein